MTSRADARQLSAQVRERIWLSDHLVRLVLAGDGLAGFVSTGIPDEWVALTVPGQFQTRYYTVRSWDGEALVLDVVVHEHGLVTEWARTDCVGDEVGIGEPKGSFALPPDALWLVLVGDLTALPAVSRIAEAQAGAGIPVVAHLEVPGGRPLDYVDPAAGIEVHWTSAPSDGPEPSALEDVVRGLDWPEGPGYFWMAGESRQMRGIRKHLRIELGRDSRSYDVMGYWRKASGPRRGAVDPGPLWREGKAAGRSDAEIWAAYDAARDAADR